MHHFARRTAGYTALLAAAGLVVAGCSKDDDNDKNDTVASSISSISSSVASSAATVTSSVLQTTTVPMGTTEQRTPGAAEETKIATQRGDITVSGSILDKYVASGGPSGALGAPLEAQEDGPDDGKYQDFVGGTIYKAKDSDAHIVWGEIRKAWEDNGGAKGKLGYPISDEKDIAGGKESDFTGGTITWVDGKTTVTPK
ncbi:LGFP repeat-containing protein [Nocardia tenerifensis]|uniref:LGFP repeat-containing protein n=1 Tax=Nocardia tenerifensis TaxID=228006 RepID=A0A318K7S5_9NOCA|nr:esterase [Nocardia tenerifensis]PXX68744.1 LGFP repeat-containing protein [Nocardia tenerifensis]